jgi:cytochrome b subunit of formate dehydrogenase
MTEEPWDSARIKALDRVDAAEKRFYLYAILLGAVDILFLFGFIQLSDFSNRVHVLIFWLAAFTYTTIAIGGVLLWASLRNHVSRMTALVLKAIDASANTAPFRR